MTRRYYAAEIDKSLDKQFVVLKGWVHELRELGNIKFLLLRDNSGIVQVTIIKKNINESKFKEISKISKESVIEIDGQASKSKEAPNGIEVIMKDFNVLSLSKPVLPLEVTEKTPSMPQQRFDFRSIDLRKPKNHAIFIVQSKLIEGIIEYLNANGFIQVFTPCIMGSASESGADVFKIDYYGKKAFLRQDPQLHRQLTIAAGFEKIYDLGPSWRAEVSHTTKHLCEHRTIAVETAFINDEVDVIRLQENLVIASLKKVNKECKEQLKLLNVKLKIPESTLPELRFPQVYYMLEKHDKNIYGQDLDAEAEKIIHEYVRKKYNSEFYFLNRFPFKIKPFYVMRVDDEKEWARSIDLYYNGVELSSGGQREHRYQVLISQIKEKGLNPEHLEWFTKFFQYGVCPHGGFALGIERLTKQLLNLENIRDAVLFPRDPERLLP
ncbi:aspartate--tRNA(Asn) ligase [Candidatus Woesearchaeota archaeon]|nr:aspartate--tRNA(Asn) ligase [Candidatus Woesearchaeota archaeon]